MKLYQTYTSPFPTRVRLVLYAKGLTPEIIEPPGFHATVESKGDYYSINPIGRVPTLVTDDGRALPESEVICEYLEEAYPEPPTLPKDPWGRSQVRLISRLCDFYLVMAMRPLFTASGQSRKRWDRAAIDRGLEAVETALGYIEAYIGDGAGGRWYTFDARHNMPRIGRILLARGRDATDIPMLFTFGPQFLSKFEVTTEEIKDQGQLAC